MPVANVNGQAIHYEDSGGDGPAVIFSHGFLMDHSMFDAQVAALDGYRCIRWDERGFGGTDAAADFTYWDSADDAVALLDHLGIDRAVFVGMSQGGFLSFRAALNYPERVRALVLIDTEPGVDPPEVLDGYRAMIGHWTSSEPLGDVGEFVAGLILGDPELNATWIEKWEQRRSDPAKREQMVFAAETLLSRDDITDRVSEINCPVLIVHGTDDQSIAIAHADAYAANLGDVRGFVRVEGAAHAPNMTHPTVVNPPLIEFLANLAP